LPHNVTNWYNTIHPPERTTGTRADGCELLICLTCQVQPAVTSTSKSLRRLKLKELLWRFQKDLLYCVFQHYVPASRTPLIGISN
jgi:hypothetical protein